VSAGPSGRPTDGPAGRPAAALRSNCCRFIKPDGTVRTPTRPVPTADCTANNETLKFRYVVCQTTY
jgi:hypothetical protein